MFHGLSSKYGQIFSLWFGHHFFVVVSSLPLVSECFSKNDIVLADRPRFLIGKYIGYNYTTISTSCYGDHWRNLRRIISIQGLSPHRLNSFTASRTEEAKMLIKNLAQGSCSGTFSKVELRSKLTGLTFNIITRMVTGKRHYDDSCDMLNGKDEAKEFIKLIQELISLGAASNPSDFLPILRWFDFGDVEKKLQRISKRTDELMQGFIDEHRNGKESKNTMIEHLLTLQQSQPDFFTDQIIKGLISCFELEQISNEEIDMTEGKGASMPKEIPLEAMCKARPIMKKVFF
ncbi:hypothetical protein L6164_026370 [Bauhinia variegata]|uniref:Uncharacterized protein n=1 Tax=Bauhinia variegata TaxID=167791 RepID=A0ACB9LQL8_BAUVA|nr:hypothetical protein L6164_026370 [Bauhinia variegata]